MVQVPRNPLILIDDSSYLCHVYRTFPPLTNSAGGPVGVMYGILNMLRSLIIQYKSTHATVVFDAKGKASHDELLEHYKSHRPSIPDDLQAQIEPLHVMVKAMGLPLLAVSGIEADDVIDTLAHEAEKAGRSVLTSIGDEDMTQLVTPNITFTNTMTNTILEPEGVVNRYGMLPGLIIDFLALTGDPSDNIPGVPDVGEKTAQVLLQGLGRLDTLCAGPEKIAGLSFHGVKTMVVKLEQSREVAYLSYQLATIKTGAELGLTCEQLEVQSPAARELLGLFRKYEFKRWAADVEAGRWLQARGAKPAARPQETSVADEAPEVTATVTFHDNYVTILDGETLKAWIVKLERAPVLAFDAGIDSLDSIFANLVGFSFAIEPGVAAYTPAAHDHLDTPDQISRKRAFELLKPLLEDEEMPKVGQNLKYDRGTLANYSIELREVAFDTIPGPCIFSSVAGCHDIDSLAERWSKHKTITFEEIAGKDKNQLTFNQIAFEEAGRYVAKDADVTLRLHLKIRSNLQKRKGSLNVFGNIEMPLVPVPSHIERSGVKIDPKVLHNHSREPILCLVELEKKAHEIAGEEFNLSLTKQLQTILFEKQGIKPLKKTPDGAPSTSEEVLKELALDYSLPKVIPEYRGLAKLRPTYTDKLSLIVSPKAGRVHTSYHQIITATGRLSSTDPNLQNIPVRSEEGRRARQALIASEDYVIASTDYLQIELHIIAHLSRDKSLLTAFTEGEDIRHATVVGVFSLPLETVTSKQRRSAEAVNFGLIYGMNAFGLTWQLNIPRKEAQKYMDFYLERYPSVLEYMEYTRTQAEGQGYVKALDGRHLYLPDIKSSDGARRAVAERAATNVPMQGTAADTIKRTMIAVNVWLQAEQPRVHMVMQIYDELIFEVRKDDVDAVTERIRQLVEDCIHLDVPLLVEVGSNENWSQVYRDLPEHALLS